MRKILLTMALMLIVFGRLAALETPDGAGPAPSLVPERAQVTLGMGTSFVSHIGSSYFVEPTIRKQISPRLQMAAALRYARYDLKPLPWATYESDGDLSSVRVSLAGIYRINEKWTVWGSVTHQFGDARFGPASSYDVYSLGAEYRPNESTWVRAELSVAKGLAPYWGPYAYGAFYPFYDAPWYYRPYLF
ncbi:MAG: hypothetical protein K6F98_02515 [Bacteroidales bacterium]|nr:hypothetical protein [Bacteroidales bacterium]